MNRKTFKRIAASIAATAMIASALPVSSAPVYAAGNIISNSYKYANTPIQIQYAYEEHFLSMAISDQGSGIPEAELSKITQKYYRGKNAAGKEGSGLGLYISGVLMQKMQGELLCTAASDDPESESPGLNISYDATENRKMLLNSSQIVCKI